jgi:AcrR family transcriptional regulator
MRADARRNHDAVLDAGARLLAEHPAASMQEIADASGVGRTTVYRHFPAREDLVAALVARVAEQVTEVTQDAVGVEGPAEAVLGRLATDLVALGSRWRFLRSQRDELRASLSDSDRAYLDWVKAAQGRGDLRDDLPADWILAMTRGLVTEAIEESDALGAERAGELLRRTLISSLAPRP